MTQQRLRAIGLVGCTLMACALAFWAALQHPASFNLDIGGELRPRPNAPTIRDVYAYDAPFLIDVHEPEPATIEISTTATYRWTLPQALIRVPALGGASASLRVLVAPQPMPSTPLTLTLNSHVAHVELPQEQRLLTLYAPGSATGNLEVLLKAPAYQPVGDPRELGLTLFSLQSTPHGWMPVASWGVWGALVGMCGLLALGGLLSFFSPGEIATTVLIGGAALTLGLLIDRTTIALGAGRWLMATAASVAGLGLWRGGSALVLLDPATRRDAAWVAGLTMVGWAIRVGGMRHPQANFSDLLLNTNNQTGVFQGTLFFDEGLPPEAGGGAAPYPPGLYLLLLPIFGIFRDPAGRGTVMQIGTALLDSLTIPLIWWAVYTLRPDRGGRWYAFWSAALYAIPLPALRSLIIGELANVGGQAMAMPALLGLIVWAGYDCPRRWRWPLVWITALAMLGHSGVLISLVMTAGLWAVGLALERRWRVLGQMSLVGLSAAIIAVALYYSSFLVEPLPPGAGVPPELRFSLGTKVWIFIQGSILRLDADTPVWIWLLSLTGAASVGRAIPRWRTPLFAWLATAPASFVSLLWSAQTVRWWTWVYPALCISGGIALGRLSLWRGLGRRLAITLFVAITAASLGVWIAFIADYRTGAFVP